MAWFNTLKKQKQPVCKANLPEPMFTIESARAYWCAFFDYFMKDAISDAEGIQDHKAIGERAEEIARAARAYADAALDAFHDRWGR